MAWLLKPVIPGTATFSGQMAFEIDDIEIDESAKKFIDSVGYRIYGNIVNKIDGFTSTNYKMKEKIEVLYLVKWVLDLPHQLKNQLHRLAIGINGAGVGLQIQDDFIAGNDVTSVIVPCRWKNAGAFVDNSELLCGGTMHLLAYLDSTQVTILEYQKVIDIPPSTLQWQFHIDDSSATDIYNRII